MKDSLKSGFAKPILVLLLTLVGMNCLFVLLHFVGDMTPVEVAQSRIREGISHQNIVPEDYPIARYGIQTPYVLVGLDQYTECNIVYQMSLYRDEDRWKNAIVPGIAEPSEQQKEVPGLCRRVIGMATGEYPQDPSTTETKARLWHGAKAVFLLLAPVMDIFQIKIVMQQLTYLFYFMMGVAFTLYGGRQMIIFLPYAIWGVVFSGIPYFADLSNGLPYLVVLTCVTGVLVLGRFTRSRFAHALLLTVFGSIHAFFFVTDGAEMMVVPFLLIALYFASFEHLPRRARIKTGFILISVYLVSFAASILLKQVFSMMVIGPEAVFQEFVDAIVLRLSGQSMGDSVTIARTIENQFGFYLDHVFYIRWLYKALLYSAFLAWTFGLALLVFKLIEGRETERCVDASVIVVAGLVVMARYIIMRNHSYMHAAFVSRYLFVFLASGWALPVFLLRDRFFRGDGSSRQPGRLPVG